VAIVYVGRAGDPLFGFLLDVVSRTRIIAEIDYPSKAIEAVSNSDVKRLSKYSITLSGVSDDLCVSTGHIEYYRILSACNITPHLDVCSMQMLLNPNFKDVYLYARPMQ
jgi:hypothetical protein